MPRIVANWTFAAALACLILAIVGLASAGADAGGPGEDHLVASRLPVAGNAQAVTLARFNGAGTSDGANWSLPTSPSGSNNRFTLEGDSNAVGALARSADGRYITLAGYTQPLGATLGNSSDTAPRVVARVDSLGNVDTSTTLSTNFTQEKIRGAVTNDGSGFWVTGHGNTASPKGGMVYAPLGSSKPTVLFTKDSVSPSNSALNNTRTVQIAGGNVYFGSEKGTAGIYRTTGLPTSAQAPTSVISFGADGSGPISELLLKHESGAASIDTMYVVQETVGIFKFSFNGSTWTNQGKVASGAYNAVTGKVDGEGHFRLYAILGGGAENSIVTMTDTAAYNAAPSVTGPTVVTTAPAGIAYRGIAFAPHDPSLAVPGAPTGVSATAGDAKASLTWTEPTEAGGSPISAYRITPYIAGIAQTSVTTPTAATSYTVEGLANGTAYTFTVAAVNSNGAGPESSPSAPVTPQAPGAPLPTIALSDTALEGTVSDPTNPTVSATVAQAGTDPEELSLEATASTNEAVAPVAGVHVTGSGSSRTVSVSPGGSVGYADITLRITGEEAKSATAVLHYAASAASPTPATSRYYSAAADASTAVDVGGGYVLLGDDENNTLRLYRGDASGAPVKTWNFGAQMGSPEEIDIEASARSGNTIYWTGSMGNSKKGNLKPDRSILFTTHISGSGASTELTFGGYYRGLRGDLIQWDEENGDRFGFAAGAAAGNIPKQIDGFNVEGLEFAPGSSSTVYLGFRAPLSPASAGGDAIVVPITNVDQLAPSGQNTSVHATFGAPILMDLDGLSVREMRKNADDQYLIIAGSWAAGGEQALYSWDGMPADPPVRTLTPLPTGDSVGEDPGSWESIVEVPDPLLSGSDLQIVMDDGSADLYGDGQEAKELIPEFQKSRSEHVSVVLPGAPVNTVAPTIGSGSGVGDQLSCSPGSWSGDAKISFSYQWKRNDWSIANGHGNASTYTVVPDDTGKSLSCEVTATNSLGSATATSSSNPIFAGPRCNGADIVGAGSSVQEIAQSEVWKPRFEDTLCDSGTHPTISYQSVGSGAGMQAWSFDGVKGSIDTNRSYIGTDAPPSAAQIANIESAAGGAQLAVIPVAQTAIAILANPPAGCTVDQITNSNLAAVFEGRIASWDKVEGAAGAGCKAPSTRVVRADASGTTYQLKNYLFQLYKKGLFCTEGGTEGRLSWREMEPLETSNTAWPEACFEKSLSKVVRAGEGPGGIAEVNKVDETPGGIGYAALPDAKAIAKGGTEILELQNNGQRSGFEAEFADPATVKGTANCGGISYTGFKLGASLDVDWSGVFGARPAVGGTSYPLCALTYDLAFHGYRAAGFAEGQEITVRDYLDDYVVQAAGQAEIAGNYYSRLPTSAEPRFDVLSAARRAAAEIGW
jgi:Fibronectin type III domain/Protein of unknown function (DUF3616)